MIHDDDQVMEPNKQLNKSEELTLKALEFTKMARLNNLNDTNIFVLAVNNGLRRLNKIKKWLDSILKGIRKKYQDIREQLKEILENQGLIGEILIQQTEEKRFINESYKLMQQMKKYEKLISTIEESIKRLKNILEDLNVKPVFNN